MTEQTLFERAVEAGANEIALELTKTPFDREKRADWIEKAARAALLAALKVIREPDQTMLDAGSFEDDGAGGGRATEREHWRAMIDTLIREGEAGK